MRASSPSGTPSCGAPATRSRAVGEFEIVLGDFQHVARELPAPCCATARAASSTDEPAVTNWRLAKPPSPTGTTAVSPEITCTSAGATPSSLAQICASAVLRPCPMAAAPVKTEIRPDGEMRTTPDSNGPRPVPFMAWASPMPDQPALRRAPLPAAPESRPSPTAASTAAWQAG